jgi:hypothetical protein
MRMTIQSLSINPDDVLGTRDEFEAKVKAQQEGRRRIRASPPRRSRPRATRRSPACAATPRSPRPRPVPRLSPCAEARAGTESEKIASNERITAVKIAVEDNRAAEARAEGQPAEAATGKGIG